MRFWIARDGGVPVREQLVTQIVLGILSGDLGPGHRLPSTRELARRFRVHANTVSAAYRQLQRDSWVEFRHGSGVYVRKSKPRAALPSHLALDQLIANLFQSAREIGAPMSTVRERLRRWVDSRPPDHFLLIEPDEELRRIVVAEMREAVSFPVNGSGLDACNSPEQVAGAMAVALPSKAEIVRQALAAGSELIVLNLRSVPGSLGAWLPAPSAALVAIASRWPEFLKHARTILVAAGFEADSLVFREARKAEWVRGLKGMAAVVCDSVTRKAVPRGCRVIPFSLIAESSFDELRRHQKFVTDPVM
jgi:GntR family transcriptional regulator